VTQRTLTTAELRIFVPLILVVLLWSWAFPALDQYNVTWDEALGDFFFGERYLSYFTSFDAVYLDFLHNPYPEERRPDLFVSPFKVRPWEYYPVANIAAAAVSTVLSRWLGLVDAFDGFHALNLLLAAPFLFFFHRFLARREGLVAATVASVLLLTAPRLFCHLMANIKDFPLLVLFSMTAMVGFRALEVGSVRGIVLSGVLLGLALGTKANALFFPAIPLLVVALGGVGEPWRGRRLRLACAFVASGVVAVGVMIAVWPYLWADPIGHYAEHLRYVGFRAGYTRPESLAPAFEAILLTTPLPFLALFAVGLVPCLTRAFSRDRVALLYLVWIVVVLGRFLLPQSVNFDGVRHFLEVLPPLAAVAGLGASSLIGLAGKWLPVLAGVPAKAALAALLLLPGAWTLVRTHPFQIAYWNAFAGGTAGAYAKNLPQAGDYWGMSYRLGLEWLNDNAPPDSALAVPVVEHAVRLVAAERLREDIFLLPVTTPFSPRIAPERLARTRELARQRPVYVMFVERRDWANALMVDCLRGLQPEVSWELDGTPILAIYRYRPPP
jgi:hypothetical protein